MSVAHFGVGMFVLGVTLVSAYAIESDQSMRAGQTLEVAGHSFELREFREVEGPNFSAVEGSVEIRRNGEFVGEVRPQKRQYLVQKSPMTEAGIQVQWNKDLFVALGDQLGNGLWSVRIQYKPMIRFIWLGALVMALGGLIAVTDRRYRMQGTN
jgi:cytochrome c-type biogenesis protein CcmF